jgi:hypothetical protein
MLKEKLAGLPALYTTDEAKGDLTAVRLYIPNSNASWVLWEYDPEEGLAFGLCDLGLGFPEMGYVSVAEMESLTYEIHHDYTVTTRFEGYRKSRVPVPEYLMA